MGIGFILLEALILAMALYMSVGRLIYDADLRKRLVYAVTDKRAIILSRLFRTSVRSVDLKTLGGLSLDEFQGGRGTISFGEQSVSHRWQTPSMGGFTRFFQIEQPKRVFDLIRATTVVEGRND